MSKSTNIRKGCKDVWNAFMVEGATFCQPFDIPFCPTTLETIPNKLVPYTEAKSKVFDSGIQYLKRDSDTIQEILSNFDPDLYDDDEAYRDDMRAYQSESQKGYYSMNPLSAHQRHMIDIYDIHFQLIQWLSVVLTIYLSQSC